MVHLDKNTIKEGAVLTPNESIVDFCRDDFDEHKKYYEFTLGGDPSTYIRFFDGFDALSEYLVPGKDFTNRLVDLGVLPIGFSDNDGPLDGIFVLGVVVNKDLTEGDLFMRFYILEDDFSVLLSPDVQAISRPLGYIDIVEPDELALVLFKNVGLSYEVFTVSYPEETDVDDEEPTEGYTD